MSVGSFYFAVYDNDVQCALYTWSHRFRFNMCVMEMMKKGKYATFTKKEHGLRSSKWKPIDFYSFHLDNAQFPNFIWIDHQHNSNKPRPFKSVSKSNKIPFFLMTVRQFFFFCVEAKPYLMWEFVIHEKKICHSTIRFCKHMHYRFVIISYWHKIWINFYRKIDKLTDVIVFDYNFR